MTVGKWSQAVLNAEFLCSWMPFLKLTKQKQEAQLKQGVADRTAS